MSKITKSRGSKFASIAVSVLMVAGLSAPAAQALTESQIQSILGLLSSFGAPQATIDDVNSALRGEPTSGGGGTTGGTGTCNYTFASNYSVGDSAPGVMDVQKFLNMDPDTQIASGSDAGAPGYETSYFGPRTKAAVIKFQDKYTGQVLTPVGLSAGTGYWGPSSRAYAQTLCDAMTGGDDTGDDSGDDTGGTTGTGLTVSASSQPAASLAPANAARVPFTKFTVTASADGPVTLSNVTVERRGLATDVNFSGVVLMDDNGTQIGIAKTLNSNHQATVGEAVTIPAGTSRTFTIAANMAAAGTVEAGAIAQFAVVAVNSPAAVSGSLPITGASHTINASLSIGSVTMARGGEDPGADQTKEVGTTGYTFSSVRVTAGSVEKVRLNSIRWNQTGSASASDIANLMTYVDGVAYPTTVSADGKYFTAVFNPAIVIDKGASKNISIKGDIAGGANRNIAFDIAKRHDIAVSGDLYGYGIIPPQTNSCGGSSGTSCFTNTENPWYDGAVVTIDTGNLIVSTNSAVAAQNVAVNAQNQPLGGYKVDVRGEAITVSSIVFNIGAKDVSGTSVDEDDITNISLVDGNGNVLAGPVDAAAAGTVTFSDAVTFPVGVTEVTLKGKLGTDFASNDTVRASTTPSTQWTSITGDETGNSITASPTSALTSALMTVKAGAMTVSVSSQPVSQSVVAGASQFEFARYIFDASQSGENVRVTTIPLAYGVSNGGTATDLTNCQLYDGSTSVTSGSNTKNPSAAASSTSFTFDGTGLIVNKGSSKTLSLKCDLRSGSTGAYLWGLDTAQATSFTGVSGVDSGQTIAETLNESNGQTMTAATSGSYTVSNDSSILYKVGQAGTTGVTLGAFKFEAGTTEDLTLKQIALQLGNTASNSPADLVNQKVQLYHGTTMIGEAQFGLSNGDYATATLNTPVEIARGESETITIKGDLATQNAITGTPGAFLVVNYDGNNNGVNGNYATGKGSGSTISGGTTSDQTTNGVRIYRTVPTVEDVTSGTSLAAGSDLYKVKVSAASGRDVLLRAMTFGVSGTGVGVSSGFKLYGPSGAVNSSGAATATDPNISGADRLRINFDNTNVDRLIPAGGSKTFALRAESTEGLTSNNVENLNIFLVSDSAAATTSTNRLVYTVAELESSGSTTDRFIWSPNSTTTPEATAAKNNNTDWTNSYGIPGFPSVGQNMSTRVFSH